jgi:hypothetical protein
MTRCRPPLRFVRARLTGGMKQDYEAVGIGDLHVPTEVAVRRCRVADSKRFEAGAPAMEVVDGADVERDGTEASECACAFRLVVQAEDDSAVVADDDTDNVVFIFENEARLEAEHVDIPVAATHDIRHGQPNVMQAEELERTVVHICEARNNAERCHVEIVRTDLPIGSRVNGRGESRASTQAM